MAVERSALLCVVRDLLAAELAELRRTDPLFVLPRADPVERLGPDGVGLDSFEFLTVASAVSRMFGLAEAGIDDYLLARPTLNDWTDLVSTVLDERDATVTFRTSGTTGSAKAVSHRYDDLLEEARFFSELLGANGTYHVTVPTHHIYGFLFGALVPAISRNASREVRGLKLPRLHASPGDVIVAFPYALSMLRSGGTLPGTGVTVVTSTAPCPEDLAAEVRTTGVRLVEVYGSTETAGVGWRDTDGPYELLPAWHRDGDGIRRASSTTTEATSTETTRAAATAEAGARPLPDDVEWIDERRFFPLRRRDAAVQVGGVNVVPAEVEAVLAEHPSVSEVAVRPVTTGGDARLKAFVVPADQRFSEDELRAYLVDTLSAPARPAVYTVGDALPRNAMGKLCDWPV